MGNGLPSFYIADLGDMSFTLGLSSWTANDWSTAGNFDLMAPRSQVDLFTQEQVFNTLKETWFETSKSLSQKLKLDPSTVASSLTSYTQAGRVVYDINMGVYRVRELTQEPLNISQLRFSSVQEESANLLIDQNKIKITYEVKQEQLHISGTVKDQVSFKTLAVIDKDNRLTEAKCQCSFYQYKGLRKGPCEHILATRIAFVRK